MASLVAFKLNGRAVTAPAGIPLLEACRRNGAVVPEFCYHPGLSIAGNCRMCLVKEAKAPRPFTSCTTPVAEGMDVDTEGAEVKKAREAVLEFLLINHPLDCPVCDKAGECMLQDHSFLHGPDRSRFQEAKEIRHTKVLGPKIKIWGNRCILCTRCVRFLDEVTGTSELCIVERGDRAIIDVFPGRPLENPMALNVVDVCPVGALISTDFLYQARVWYMRSEKSVCAGCSRGCSIQVDALDGIVKRLRPRPNPEVNGHWMCDYGRLEYRYANGGDRLARFRNPAGEPVPPAKAIGDLVSVLCAWQGIGQAVADFRTLRDRLRSAPAGSPPPGSGFWVLGSGKGGGVAPGQSPIPNPQSANPAPPLLSKERMGGGSASPEGSPESATRNPQSELPDGSAGAARPSSPRSSPSHQSAIRNPQSAISSPPRLSKEGPGEDAPASLSPESKIENRKSEIAAIPPVALLASLWMTNEELFLLSRIAGALGGARVFAVGRPPGPAHRFPGGFTISADKNPNRRGAEAILGKGVVTGGTEGFAALLAAGKISAALLVGGFPGFALDPALEKTLARATTAAVLHFAEVPLAFPAIRLAGVTFAEKDGTFTNEDGRVQRVRRAIPPPGEALPDLEILQRIAQGIGAWGPEILSAEGVFRELRAEVPAFGGLDYRTISDFGSRISAQG